MDTLESGLVAKNQIADLSPREAFQLCADGAVILDVREEYVNQYKRLGVPCSIQIPMSRLHNEFNRLPLDRLIIVVDSSGIHSKEAIVFLKDKGFTRLSNLAGGLVEWERDGMPLITNNSEKLTGSCACQLRARDKNSTGNIT